MTKAFAHLRVSGKGQVQGDGFPRQLAAIKQYAATHDMDPFTLKKLAGHESLETTMKYIHLNEGESEARLREVRDKLADEASTADLAMDDEA